jgi:ABC-type multidrug transport system fused ATPase/permease subunit
MERLNKQVAGVRVNISKSLELLSPRFRKKYFLLTLAQSTLSLLDLVSVAVVGIIASVAVNGINQVEPGNTSTQVLEFFHLTSLSIQSQTVVLSVTVGIFLVSKSLLSLFLNRKVLNFLGQRSAELSEVLISKLIKQNALVIESKSAQELIYIATTGVNSIIVGVLGNFSSLVSDLALCVVLGVGLLIYSPLSTMLTIALLGSILLVLFVYLNRESQRLSKVQTSYGIRNASLLAELIENYRESVVRHRRGHFAAEIVRIRHELASIEAKQSWLPNISKYVIEITVTLFTLLLAYLQFSSKDAVHAVGSLAIFLVAGARLAPSLLRIQQFVISMNSHAIAAEPTLTLFNRMKSTDPEKVKSSEFSSEHVGFRPLIEIRNMKFSYPNAVNLEVKVSNFTIKPGEFVAIVGASGAGKTTLVDLILGILDPTSGSVAISSLPPEITFQRWPGAVGYVSQRINFPAGTVRSCVIGGFEGSNIPDEDIWDCLEKVQLSDYVRELPLCLDEPLGEKASKLSGGQRQRLAIARALLTRPRLLVMDEATSSLDSETETKVSQSIQNLHGEVTLLVVAHRLSTVRMADRILYMENGSVMGEGTFQELRETLPGFDKQARLMGL